MDECDGQPSFSLASTDDSLLTLLTAREPYVHLVEANAIDPSGDWSDAARFPEKYAVWSQQMPQSAVRPNRVAPLSLLSGNCWQDDHGWMKPSITVTYPQTQIATKPASASSSLSFASTVASSIKVSPANT